MEYCFAIYIFCGILSFASAGCNRNTGPPGSIECVSIERYGNTPQWATCLSNAYIQVKSEGRHICADRTRTYCWYQCMCELNNQCDGPDVYRNCSCDPNTPHTTAYTTMSPSPTLPPWCFSPSGEDCTWYRECLETKYPCEDTDSRYAINYAEYFCNLYSQHYQKFSVNGQRWIDTVRKCLQVELVPILRPWITISCDGIKQMAFNSHARCYTNPSIGVSFCYLPVSDVFKVFWTIKGAFLSAFVESLKGLWDVIMICHYRYIDEFSSSMILKINKIVSVSNDFIGKVINAIATEQEWNVKGIAWFGYHLPVSNITKRSTDGKPDNVQIQVIITSKLKFDLNSLDAPVVNLTQTMMSLADSVKKGLPRMTIDGERVNVRSMAACTDINCQSFSYEAIATDDGNKCMVSSLYILFIGFVSASILFI